MQVTKLCFNSTKADENKKASDINTFSMKTDHETKLLFKIMGGKERIGKSFPRTVWLDCKYTYQNARKIKQLRKIPK